MKNLSLIPIVFCSFPSNLFAFEAKKEIQSSSFFQRKAEGWHWYQNSNQCSVISNQKKDQQKRQDLNPTQQIETQRKNLEKKLHTAIVEPTRENLIAKETHRTKSYYVKQAIEDFLEEREDYLLALAAMERFEKGEEKAIPFEEILKKYGAENDHH